MFKCAQAQSSSNIKLCAMSDVDACVLYQFEWIELPARTTGSFATRIIGIRYLLLMAFHDNWQRLTFDYCEFQLNDEHWTRMDWSNDTRPRQLFIIVAHVQFISYGTHTHIRDARTHNTATPNQTVNFAFVDQLPNMVGFGALFKISN